MVLCHVVATEVPGPWHGARKPGDRIEAASGGRLKIKVYGGGEMVPAFEVFDAVSRGTVEMGHDASYYHKGKVDAAQFFTAIPFGMTNMELNGWLYYGGGLELYRELYEPFNLVPFPTGNTGVQMGGWFNREINSIDDLKGLKMRIPAWVVRFCAGPAARRSRCLAPRSFTALQTGAIDATEWVGPYNDIVIRSAQGGQVLLLPGVAGAGSRARNHHQQDAWESLPADLQEIVNIACQAITTDMAAEYTHGNAISLAQLQQDPSIGIRPFPDDVLALLKSITNEIVAELMAADPASAKIGKAFFEYMDKVAANSRISEEAYLHCTRPVIRQ